MIRFEPDTCQASFAGESIRLLPKEFALFRYLYENAGRSFTWEQLLDAVWPLEAPVDRTVDDHVYRIRKKLSKWSHLFSFDTIRGQGYKLTLHASSQPQNPLLHDEQFTVDVGRMMSKYHGLGMGAAMHLLSANRDVLGLPDDPFYDAYVHFVQGDFEWLLQTDSLDFWQKAAYMVHVYSFIQFDHRASLHYFERLIAEGDEALSLEWRYDLRLHAIHLRIELGEWGAARERLEAIRDEVIGLESPSYDAMFGQKEIYLDLMEGRTDAAFAKLSECEELLERHPMQRERGAYLIVKAMCMYERGEIESARAVADEGIATIKNTQFVPHLISGLNAILTYLGGTGTRDESYRQLCLRQWELLKSDYRFDELAAKTERLLRSRL